MKKLYLFMILLLLVSPLLMAAGGNTIKVRGYITAIDTDAMTITVDDTLIQVTTSTLIYEKDVTGDDICDPIDFSALVVGDRVIVKCKLVGDMLVAKNILVH